MPEQKHIFADHCVHRDVVIALQRSGFPVETAYEVGLNKSPDEQLYRYCKATKQVLLTFDSDFGNIIRFDIKKSSGIVLVYIEGMDRETIVKRILDFFTKTNIKKIQGRLTIIQENSIKHWPA